MFQTTVAASSWPRRALPSCAPTGGLIGLVVVIIGVGLVVALAQVAFVLAVVAGVVVALIVGAIALVGSATSGIFTASLYRYATKGDAGAMYRPETLSAAFRTKS